MIELGDQVKDKHSGFKGTVLARTEYINGCVQYTVCAKVGKDNKPPEELGIDEECLEIVKKKKVPKEERSGGAMRTPPSMRGY